MSRPARAAEPADDLIARLRGGDRLALARALSAVEDDGARTQAIQRAIYPHAGRALVIGVTGAPGAGKSTLVNALIKALRASQRTVGVIAVDPSSPLSGGAILGDRVRMDEHTMDDGVFVRSLAARGHLGGLSRAAVRAIDVMDAAGKDVVVVETVGAGQSEVEIAAIARVRVVVSAPGLGDDVQAIKAGILEIADILVVNKADLPLADRTVKQLTGMLSLGRRAGWTPPVLKTVATSGDGVAELAAAIECFVAETGGPSRADPRARTRRLIAGEAADLVRDGVIGADGAVLDRLSDAVQRGDIDLVTAARRAMRHVAASLDPERDA